MATRIGTYTLQLEHSPSLAGFAAVAGKKEAQGPLAQQIDLLCEDSTFGETSWEKAESQMQKAAVNRALKKCSLSPAQVQYLFAGDLLNQCIGSTYGLRDLGIPFLGVYGACSTMAESLALASLFIEGGFAHHCLAVTSSHFCSAERQFRFPLEYGGQRPTTSQWTVTGAGACVVSQQSVAPYVRAITVGTMEDLGICDVNNMGAAMAPAAAKTLLHFFEDTCTGPDNYDAIFTGDLGLVGSRLLVHLMEERGYQIAPKHHDCGLMIFDRTTQDVHAGGSGCGCCAVTLCSHILPQLRQGRLTSVLFLATGALMSTTSVQQGQSIPGIAHLLHLSSLPAPQ